jgi:hypothetical protein
MTFAKLHHEILPRWRSSFVSSVEFLLAVLSVILKSTAMHGKPATACPKYHMYHKYHTFPATFVLYILLLLIGPAPVQRHQFFV